MTDLRDILGIKAAPAASGRQDFVAPDPEAIAQAFATAAAAVTGQGRDDAPAKKRSLLRPLGLLVAFGAAACATATLSSGVLHPAAPPPPSPEELALGFALGAPAREDLGPNLRLWATHYHTPTVTPAPATISAAFPLIGRDGEGVSPPLTHRDWCEAALQGSVSVTDGARSTAYVFVDSGGPEQANCDEWLGTLSDGVKNATRRARFMQVNHPLGCDVRNHPLAPFRTIGVDPDVIPLESVVFVPELRGRAFTYDGRDFVHDGYLFAGDRGGAIKGRHIDVFLTKQSAGPLEDLFASHDGRTFAAHVVSEDDPAAEAVRATQSARCEAVTTG